MTLREAERRRAPHKHSQKKRRRLRQQHERLKHKPLALDAPLTMLHDDQVLTFLEWCRLNRISERNGRRILDGPNAPVLTLLSPRRVGITVRANREWQRAREAASTTIRQQRRAAKAKA